MSSEHAHLQFCVLLRPGAADDAVVQQVTDAAEQSGFTVTVPGAELEPGASVLSAVLNEIQRASVVVAILDQGSESNIWFALGMAAANQRPILIVLTDDEVVLPAGTTDLQTVGPTLDNRSLRRALHYASRRSIVTRPPADIRTGVALGSMAANLELSLRALPRTAVGASGAAFEDWFSVLLRQAKVPFEQASPVSDEDVPRPYANVDFAVSADELSANLGNPLPVELIVGQANRVIPGRRKTFDSYIRATGANTLLVLSVVDEPATIWPIVAGDVLSCSADSLLEEMRSATFGEAVLAVHNAAARRGPLK